MPLIVKPAVPLIRQLSIVTLFVTVFPVAFGLNFDVTLAVGVFELLGKVIPPFPLTVIVIYKVLKLELQFQPKRLLAHPSDIFCHL